jgi:hypothetical protein
MSYGQNGILNTVRYIPKPESIHPFSRELYLLCFDVVANPSLCFDDFARTVPFSTPSCRLSSRRQRHFLANNHHKPFAISNIALSPLFSHFWPSRRSRQSTYAGFARSGGGGCNP